MPKDRRNSRSFAELQREIDVARVAWEQTLQRDLGPALARAHQHLGRPSQGEPADDRIAAKLCWKIATGHSWIKISTAEEASTSPQFRRRAGAQEGMLSSTKQFGNGRAAASRTATKSIGRTCIGRNSQITIKEAIDE